jgi:nucleoside triphosphatase
MTIKKYPEPIVGALIFNQEGKIFFMKSPKWKDKLVIPGGHIEQGESIEQALRREIKEETNLRIFDIEFSSVHELIFSEEFHKKRHFIFLNYTCKTKDSNVVLNKEGVSYIWMIPEKALKSPNLLPSTKIAVLKARNKKI